MGGGLGGVWGGLGGVWEGFWGVSLSGLEWFRGSGSHPPSAVKYSTWRV